MQRPQRFQQFRIERRLQIRGRGQRVAEEGFAEVCEVAVVAASERGSLTTRPKISSGRSCRGARADSAGT
jgi:hypothetical protein